MATSGSTDFSQNRGQIIKRALQLVGAVEGGETPDADMSANAAVELNSMVKHWQTQGIHLWTRTEAVLHLTVGQASYTLSSTGAHAALASDAVKTELSADASSGASSIAVDSVSGMANGDNIGIELADGTLQWTTINGTPTTSSVPLTATLTGAASEDAHVYVYTTKLARPLRVLSARLNNEDGNDVPIFTQSHQEYFSTPNKTAQGKPSTVYYDPQLGGGILYVWVAPESVKDRIKFTILRQIEDFDGSADDPDFPQEWASALTWNLADRLTVDYSTPPQKAQNIERKALVMLDDVLAWDREPESVMFQPDFDGHG